MLSSTLAFWSDDLDTRSHNPPRVRTMKASDFKAKCLKLMDEIADSDAEIVVTKNGRPVSRLVPYRRKPKSLFGIDRGRLEVLGDLDEPLDIQWEAAGGQIRSEDHCSF